MSTFSRWLRYLGLNRKKESVIPAQQCQQKIDVFWNRMSSDDILPEEIVWMDEMGFDGRDFLCCYGWSERGKRFETCKRLGQGRRYEALVAMSIDGLVSAELYSGGTIQWGNFADFSIGTLFPDMISQGKKVSTPPPYVEMSAPHARGALYSGLHVARDDSTQTPSDKVRGRLFCCLRILKL